MQRLIVVLFGAMGTLLLWHGGGRYAGAGEQEAEASRDAGAERVEELGKIRSIVECYFAHRRSLNRFRCVYRVYGVPDLSEAEMLAWRDEARLPEESRWEPRWECVWIMQPEGGYAEGRWIGRRSERQVAVDPKTGTGDVVVGTPSTWVQLVWNGWWVDRRGGRNEITVHRVQDRTNPVDRMFGPRPPDPPTSLGWMGYVEESNVMVDLKQDLEGRTERLRYLGHRTIRGFDCVGILRHGAESSRMKMWIAPSAGCSIISVEYSYANNRSIIRCLELREVAPGRWFPFLGANLPVIEPSGERYGTVVRVEEFEWGYRASPEELTLRFTGRVAVASVLGRKVKDGWVDLRELYPEAIPGVVRAVWGTERVQLARRDQAGGSRIALLSGGVCLFVGIVLLAWFVGRRLKQSA